MSGSAGDSGRRARSAGSVYVDLQNQRLFLRSSASSISSAVNHVETWLVLRGDLGSIYVLNKIDQFEQCWDVTTAPLPTGPGRNPFAEAIFIADGFRVPGSSASTTARKYAMH